MAYRMDLTGRRFGRVVVLRFHSKVGRLLKWLCKCDCGNEKPLGGDNLRRGMVISCGCYRKGEEFQKLHFLKRMPEYNVWCKMIKRCHNPTDKSYERYGGRGITVCNRWRETSRNFFEDMGRRPTPQHQLERIDNLKGYSPENCKWDTVYNQVRNRRSNVWFEYGSRRMIQTDWAREFNISHGSLAYKLKRKSFEEIATIFYFNQDMNFLEAKIKLKTA